MASAIEDVSNLPGEMVHDQEGRRFGKIDGVFAVGDDETPMWVTVKASRGIGRYRLVFIPIARLKHEREELRAPYSFQHLQDSPEVEGDELSEEDDRTLRGYYSIGLADQEMVAGAQSYASQVPEEEGPAHKVDADSVEGRVRELDEREPGEAASEAAEAEGADSRQARKATTDDVLGDGASSGGNDEGSGDDGESSGKGEGAGDEKD